MIESQSWESFTATLLKLTLLIRKMLIHSTQWRSAKFRKGGHNFYDFLKEFFFSAEPIRS